MLKCAFGLVAVIAIAAATPAMASLHVYNFATPDDSEVTLASPASFTDNGLTVSVTGMKGAYPAGVVSDIHQNHN